MAASVSSHGKRMVEEVYSLVASLPRHGHETPPKPLPENGLYFFFERGEVVHWQRRLVERIVMVGTHRRDGQLRECLRRHYGRAYSLGGDRKASPLRKHLGAALLARGGGEDIRLADWLKEDGPELPEVEEMVSRVLRQDLTYSYIRVERQDERLALERGLVALLAQYPLGGPSPIWLGRYAADEAIRESGLWNAEHIRAPCLTAAQLRRLEELVRATLGEGGS